MHYLYIATVFAGTLVCLLASILLFLRRKEGKRSRMILAVIVFFSVYNYSIRFIALLNGIEPEFVVSPYLLFQANFMLLGYILYPIEVIAPGWLTFRNILKLYSYWIALVVFYSLTRLAGVHYTMYGSLLEMLPHAGRFDVGFSLFLALLFFLPALIVIYIYRTRLQLNSNPIWVKKYVFAFTLNVLAFLLLVLFSNPVFYIVYYYISVGCSLYVVYMELFERVISKSPGHALTTLKMNRTGETTSPDDEGAGTKESRLIGRLENYLNSTMAWRNPDLSLNTLALELMTNRTTLGNALRECGHENYTLYVNRLRTEDFIDQIESGVIKNYQDAFFLAGFRSRSTALRNFRQFTGTTPSEYFRTKGIQVEEEQVGVAEKL